MHELVKKQGRRGASNHILAPPLIHTEPCLPHSEPPLSNPALPASLSLTSAVRELVKKQESTNVKAIMQLPKMRYVIACTPVGVSTEKISPNALW